MFDRVLNTAFYKKFVQSRQQSFQKDTSRSLSNKFFALLFQIIVNEASVSFYRYSAINTKPPFRSSHLEVFLGKCVPKICSKFTGKHPCRSGISIKLQSNFIEITLRHACSPVNLLHIFRTLFPKNTS